MFRGNLSTSTRPITSEILHYKQIPDSLMFLRDSHFDFANTTPANLNPKMNGPVTPFRVQGYNRSTWDAHF